MGPREKQSTPTLQAHPHTRFTTVSLAFQLKSNGLISLVNYFCTISYSYNMKLQQMLCDGQFTHIDIAEKHQCQKRICRDLLLWTRKLGCILLLFFASSNYFGSRGKVHSFTMVLDEFFS
jgi:hypothetical protein